MTNNDMLINKLVEEIKEYKVKIIKLREVALYTKDKELMTQLLRKTDEYQRLQEENLELVLELRGA
jgi:hypothetical protein